MNGISEHEPKSVLDVEKTSANSQRTCPRSSMTDGNRPEPWRSDVMSCKCRGSWSQSQRKLVRWSPLRRCNSLGQGTFGRGGGSVRDKPVVGHGDVVVKGVDAGG